MVASCPLALLDDLHQLLAAVRTWPGVVERTPGVFALGRAPFLHFHLVDGGRRRGDVKHPAGWRQLDLPRPLPAAARRRVLAELRRCHAARLRAERRRRARRRA
jgi:hypothetical protein